MTEARITVEDGNVIKFNSPISHHADQQTRELKMFDPHVVATHGNHPDDEIILTQGIVTHAVAPGELRSFKLEQKIIVVAHQGDTIKFK